MRRDEARRGEIRRDGARLGEMERDIARCSQLLPGWSQDNAWEDSDWCLKGARYAPPLPHCVNSSSSSWFEDFRARRTH